jgi:hypothetical protein
MRAVTAQHLNGMRLHGCCQAEHRSTHTRGGDPTMWCCNTRPSKPGTRQHMGKEGPRVHWGANLPCTAGWQHALLYQPPAASHFAN